MDSQVNHQGARPKTRTVAESGANQNMQMRDTEMVPVRLLEENEFNQNMLENGPLQEHLMRIIEEARTNFRNGFVVEALRKLVKGNKCYRTIHTITECKMCLYGMMQHLNQIKFDKKLFTDIYDLYEELANDLLSDELDVCAIAFEICLEVAPFFKKKGFFEFTDNLLKNLHFQHAIKMPFNRNFYHIIEADLDEAVRLCNGQDLKILMQAINIKRTIGKTRDAYHFIAQALELKPNDQELLRIKQELSETNCTHENEFEYLKGTDVKGNVWPAPDEASYVRELERNVSVKNDITGVMHSQVNHQDARSKNRHVAEGDANPNMQMRDTDMVPISLLDECDINQNIVENQPPPDDVVTMIEGARKDFREGFLVEALRNLVELNKRYRTDYTITECKGCLNGMMQNLHRINFNKKLFADLSYLFEELADDQLSDELAVFAIAFDIRLAIAHYFNKKGLPKFNDNLLKKLHSQRAEKLPYLREFYPIIEADLDLAARLCNGQDLQVLMRAIHIKQIIGKTRDASKYIEQALELTPNDQVLQILRMQLELYGSSQAWTKAPASAGTSTQENELDYLKGTYVEANVRNLLRKEGTIVHLLAKKNHCYLRVRRSNGEQLTVSCDSNLKDTSTEWIIEKADKAGKCIYLRNNYTYLALKKQDGKDCIIGETYNNGRKPDVSCMIHAEVEGNFVRLSWPQNQLYMSVAENGELTTDLNPDRETQLFEIKEEKSRKQESNAGTNNKKWVDKSQEETLSVEEFPELCKKTDEIVPHNTADQSYSQAKSTETPTKPTFIDETKCVDSTKEKPNQLNSSSFNSKYVPQSTTDKSDTQANSIGSPTRPTLIYEKKRVNSTKVKANQLNSSNTNMKERKESRGNSWKIYTALLDHSYEIILVCKMCFIHSNETPVKIEEVQHSCSKEILLIRHKDGPLHLIRKAPRRYRRSDTVCEKVESGEECRTCTFPHSVLEKHVWNQLAQYKWDLSKLLDDIKNTTMAIHHFLMPYVDKVTISKVCKMCYNNRDFEGMFKERHKPQCKNKHAWRDSNLFIILQAKDKKETFVSLQINDIGKHGNQMLKDLALKIMQSIGMTFSENDILREYKKLEQRRRDLLKNEKQVAPRFAHFESEQRETMSTYGDSNFFDSDVSDIECNGDIECSYDPGRLYGECQKYDSSENDSFDDESGISDDTYHRRKYLYYDMMSTSKAKMKVKKNPDQYKFGTIRLTGTQQAVVSTKDGRIEVRGRHNCGTAMNGDLVVVEKIDVKKLDDQNKEKQRGRVVSVIHESFNREQYAFVCVVDPHLSHLMKPICGTAPKIHVEHSMLNHLSKDIKNTRVCLYNNNGGRLEYLRTVEMDRSEKLHQLFVVKYMKWWPSKMYPYGYVVKVIKPGIDLLSGQRVLNLTYQIPHPFSENHFVDGIDFEPDKSNRVDFRNLNTFSIDPDGCLDIDDALSVTCTEPGLYNVGIHIADVTAYIKLNSQAENEIFTRRITFYPVEGRPIFMLPPKLTSCCSLIEKTDKLALSVIITIDENGKIIKKGTFKESVIRLTKNLTYRDAQKVIDDYIDNVTVQETDIRTLNKLAKVLKQNRNKAAMYAHEVPNIVEHDLACVDAHNLVEEFMLLANKCAAEFIVNKFSGFGVFRIQHPPDKDTSDFIEQNREMLSAPSKIAYLLETVSGDETSSHFNFLRPVLEALISNDGEVSMIKNIIGLEKLHPLLAVMHDNWNAIQQPAEIASVCSRHFGLQFENYTWFTSPIRRSVDIVVHRLIKSALKTKLPELPYSKERIIRFCWQFNKTLGRQHKYSEACARLKAAYILQNGTFFMPAFVSSVAENGLSLVLPLLPRASDRNITYSELKLAGIPVSTETKQIATMWKKRIYDTSPKYGNLRSREMTMPEFQFVIDNSNKNSCTVDLQQWKMMVSAIYKGHDTAVLSIRDKMHFTAQKNQAIIEKLHSEIQTKEIENEDDDENVVLKKKYCDDVTSEMKSRTTLVRHITTFKMEFDRASVVQVQYGASSAKSGVLEPEIKCFAISDTLHACIEHVRDPILCFSKMAKQRHRREYNSIEQYVKTWRPILSMEAATVSVQDGTSIIINNVEVLLEKNNDKYSGRIELIEKFCKERHIQFISNTKNDEEESVDYLCLRFHTTSSAKSLLENNEIEDVCKHEIARYLSWNNIWVAHAVVTKTSLTSENKICIEFDVQQYHSKPTDALCLAIKAHQKLLCNLEFIAVPLPHKRMIEALDNLSFDQQIQPLTLAYSIVLGKEFMAEDKQLDVDLPDNLDIVLNGSERNIAVLEELNIPEKEVPINNFKQDKAIRKALSNRFALIQGPPGTGKTLTGIKVAYWFNEMNRKQTSCGSRRQVMYCGPSNSSVDVALKLMLGCFGKKCPKVLRIYGESLEQQIFPLPRDYSTGYPTTSGRHYRLVDKKEQKLYGLHHLIRSKHNSKSGEIRYYDSLFEQHNNSPEEVSDEQIEKYTKLITDAAVEEIPKYDIIFCTCSRSASQRIKRGAHIYQLIIDECGMCMEPESLVPLINHKPVQVVLVGDHKQLRPIVKNEMAKEMGLEESLFERYAKIMHDTNKAEDERDIVLLDEQYRMHPAICEFPSEHFYDGKLMTNASYEWTWARRDLNIWPNKRRPVVFCHVEGAEESLPVATEQGNERSKLNKAECDYVIAMVFDLVNKWNIDPGRITVLSQYKAQCHSIRKQLDDFGFSEAKVSTVIASQGDEQDYIILSTVRSLERYEISKQPSDGWLKKYLGFITDEHQTNVALTRAKKGMIIIGNKHLLKTHPIWRELLHRYEFYKVVVPAGTFPPKPDNPWKPDDPERNRRGYDKHQLDMGYITQMEYNRRKAQKAEAASQREHENLQESQRANENTNLQQRQRENRNFQQGPNRIPLENRASTKTGRR